MTDFEMGVLFVEFLGAANTVFANYMTLIFAMLTASWFLARKISLLVAVCFLAIYTLAALAIGSGVFFAFSDFFALHGFIFDSAAADGPLSWVGPVRAGGAAPLNVMTNSVLATLVLSWLGSVIFFFVVRYSSNATRPKGGVNDDAV